MRSWFRFTTLGWGIFKRHFGDFYTGADISIESYVILGGRVFHITAINHLSTKPCCRCFRRELITGR